MVVTVTSSSAGLVAPPLLEHDHSTCPLDLNPITTDEKKTHVASAFVLLQGMWVSDE